MPTYNSANNLNDSIKSVLAQDYKLWELIIIDDQSIDESIKIAQSHSLNDSRISVLQTDQNIGSGKARNLGINNSKGDLIAFLDSDDLWLPNKLDVQVKMFSDKRVSFVCSAYQRFHTTTNKTENVGVPKSIEFNDLLKTNYIGCLTVILKREVYKDLKFPEMRKRQDYALWLSLIKNGGRVKCLNQVLARYRYGHDSTTSNKLGSVMSTWKVYREFLELKLPTSFFYFFNYLIRGFFRTKLPKLSLILGLSYPVQE